MPIGVAQLHLGHMLPTKINLWVPLQCLDILLY